MKGNIEMAKTRSVRRHVTGTTITGTDNADTILKNVDYDSDDPEGMKKALEMKAMQELLDEMVAEGLLKIVGKNENGDDLYQCADE